MKLRTILLLAWTTLPAVGCTQSGSAPAPIVQTSIVPEVPADVMACRQSAVPLPARQLSAGEVERLWKTDRSRLRKVNDCFERILCQYHDVRREIGRVENEPTCERPQAQRQQR